VNKYDINIRSFGNYAVLIEWPHKVEEAILEDILRYIKVIKTKINSKIWEFIPSYNSLTLIHRKGAIDFIKFRGQLQDWYAEKNTEEEQNRFLWRLPVCYDLDFGIDQLEAADYLGISTQELIALHTAHQYTVYGIGFLPGFMYLGGLPKKLEVPRKGVPRLNVAKGAVGLAAQQTGIYPQNSPGGWNIIGNCPVPLEKIPLDA